MTVDELVEEGLQFMLAHPTANRDKVKNYLMSFAAGPSVSQERDGIAAAGFMGGLSGCLFGILMIPLVHLFHKTAYAGHPRKVEKAVKILFGDTKKKKRKEDDDENHDPA